MDVNQQRNCHCFSCELPSHMQVMVFSKSQLKMQVFLTSYWPCVASQSGDFQCVGERLLQRAISEGWLPNVHKHVVTPDLSWQWTEVIDDWANVSKARLGMARAWWSISEWPVQHTNGWQLPRKLSRKAGIAKEAARGNRLLLPSSKH